MIVRVTVLLYNIIHSNQTIQSPQVPVSNLLSKTMVFYLAIKKNKIILAENWMKLKINILNGKSLFHKEKYVFFHTRKGRNRDKNVARYTERKSQDF